MSQIQKQALMMTRTQYFRLCLVLLAPLLLLGWWLAAKEVFIPQHGVIQCREQTNDFSCVSWTTTRSRANEILYRDGPVTLDHLAQIESGFRHTVIMHAIPPYTADEGAAPPRARVRQGGSRELMLPPPGARTVVLGRLSGSCDLGAFGNTWSYMCSGGESSFGQFEFADDKVNQKFQTLTHEIRAMSKKNDSMGLRARIASTLAPVVLFLLLSLACWALVGAFRFVRGKKAQEI